MVELAGLEPATSWTMNAVARTSVRLCRTVVIQPFDLVYSDAVFR
jgi:ribosome recycling factor